MGGYTIIAGGIKAVITNMLKKIAIITIYGTMQCFILFNIFLNSPKFTKNQNLIGQVLLEFKIQIVNLTIVIVDKF